MDRSPFRQLAALALCAPLLGGSLLLAQNNSMSDEEVEQHRREPDGPQDRSDFTFLSEEGFPLNVDPKIVTADEADIGDDDIVMGVVINGAARAYPVNYMNGPYDEVVNDTLGGEAIASTW